VSYESLGSIGTERSAMNVQGITWHAITLPGEQFRATKQLMMNTLGLVPAIETDGFAMFAMPNGTVLELYVPEAVPPYGYNGSIAFGWRVDDIEVASKELAAAGCQLLGEIVRADSLPEAPSAFKGYSYRHFKGLDGRVYGINEQK
jgi:hypothetical protein